MKTVSLIGVYTFEKYSDVNIIELFFNNAPEYVALDEITQPKLNMDRLDWQAPYLECYLNESGDFAVINYTDLPKKSSTTRVAFFFHDLNFDEILITSHGTINLTQAIPVPDRLRKIMPYESTD